MEKMKKVPLYVRPSAPPLQTISTGGSHSPRLPRACLDRYHHLCYQNIEEARYRGTAPVGSPPADVPSFRSHLERRLTTLKCKVLKDFAEGGLKGEGLMAGIIALINDTRESLAGMATARNESRQPTTLKG